MAADKLSAATTYHWLQPMETLKIQSKNTIPLAQSAAPQHSLRLMKLKNLFLGVLAILPSIASAHPGHAATALHIHAGAPSALNCVDPSIVAAALLAGSLLLAARLLKQP